MNIIIELPGYICVYINKEDLVDFVFCNNLEIARNIYNSFNTVTVAEIDCMKQTRLIVQQKKNGFNTK